ncbi:TcpE family conjugal transfer membrane protein [Nonomuraea jabiensis]|uniref:TcpE family conjugal transfer membrane protein n=1 Tax=Nonomuraea jabiensis TaxID=882448 RepID=UPI003D711F1C
MDLPTYTNIWRIEKRLYKLYDLRLPMPLPIVWIGVFVGVFVPWSLLLVLVGVPVEMPWHVLYLVPPGIVTWLSTRPVIEGKRLTELLESQLRYLGQPKAWYRLAPMSEPETITFSARVWRTTPARAKSKAPRKARQPQRRREGQRISGPRQVRPAVAAAAAAASQAPVAEPTTGRWGTRRGTAPALKARVRETAPPSAPRAGVGALRREEALPGGPGRRQDAPPPGTHESSELPTREFVDARDAAAWDRGDASDAAARDRGDARDAAARDRGDAREAAARDRGDVRDAAAWDRGDAREAAVRERTGRGEAAAALADVGTQESAAETRDREAAAGVRGQEAASRDGDVQRFGSGSPDDARADREAAGAVREAEIHKPAAGKPIDTEALRRLRRLAASADAPAEPSGPAEVERRDQERDEERRDEGREERRGERREDEVARDQHRKGQPPRLGPSLVLSDPQRVWPPLNPDAKPFPRPAASRPGTESADITSTAPPQQETAPSDTAPSDAAPSPRADTSGTPSHEPSPTADAPSTLGGDGRGVGVPQPVAEVTDARGGVDAPSARDDGNKSDTPETTGGATAGDAPELRDGVEALRTAGDAPKGDAPVTVGGAAVGDASELRDGVDATGATPKRSKPQPVAEAAEGPGGSDAAGDVEAAVVAQEGSERGVAQRAAEVPDGADAQEPGLADERPERSTAEPLERSTVRQLPAKSDAPGSTVPGTRGERDASVPGTRGDRGPSVPGTRGDRGAATPGTRGDRSASFPGTRGDRSASFPGTRSDRGAAVPDARGPAAGDRRVAAASAGDPRGAVTGADDGRGAAASAGDGRSVAASAGDGRGAAANVGDGRSVAAGAGDGRGAARAGDSRSTAANVGDGRSVAAGAGDGRSNAANAGDSRGAAAVHERGGEFVAPVPVPRPGEGRVRRVESVVGRDSGGWRRIAQVVVGGGGVRTDGSEIDEARARGVFGGSRRIVVLGCTGGAGQSTTALMLGHTFARYRDDRVVAVDANTGGGTLTSKIQPETPETLTSLLSGLDRVSGYLTMRGYTTRTASGLEVISADSDAGAEQRLADRSFFSDHRLGESMRLLDRHYKLAVIDPAAALAARLLPYADQLVLVVPASEEASEAVAMTYEWLDGHGCAELRRRAVMVVNGVSRRSMADVEQAESVARGRCRAIVRVPWEDGLAPEGAEVVDPGQLRAAGKRAYLALAGVVIAGFAAQAQTVRPSEEELASDPPGTRIGER